MRRLPLRPLAIVLAALALLAACQPADAYARRVPTGVGPGHPRSFRTFGELTMRGQKEGAKPIALTFDDGPGVNTPAILDILEREHVPATFFIVGRQIRGNESVIRRMVDDGFRVGDHSWDHANLHNVHGQALADEIEWPVNLLNPLLGTDTVKCMRPPYGNTNGEIHNALADRGLAEAHWSVDPQDCKDPGAQAVMQRVLSHAFPGAIVLMHDGGNHRGTVEALPTIITLLKAAGYSFVSIC